MKIFCEKVFEVVNFAPLYIAPNQYSQIFGFQRISYMVKFRSW